VTTLSDGPFVPAISVCSLRSPKTDGPSLVNAIPSINPAFCYAIGAVAANTQIPQHPPSPLPSRAPLDARDPHNEHSRCSLCGPRAYTAATPCSPLPSPPTTSTHAMHHAPSLPPSRAPLMHDTRIHARFCLKTQDFESTNTQQIMRECRQSEGLES
jgi:hypothetical protein